MCFLAEGTLADNDSVVMAGDEDLSLLECPALDPLPPKWKCVAFNVSDELPVTARLFAVCLNCRKQKHIDLYVVCVCVGRFVVCAVGERGKALYCLARRRNHEASNLRTRA